MTPTVYLIDTMAYVFRSFFAMRSMSAPDGTPINAVFGLGMTLQRFLHEYQPQMAVCCFDAGRQDLSQRSVSRLQGQPRRAARGTDSPVRPVPRADRPDGFPGGHDSRIRGRRPDRLAHHPAARPGHEVVIVSGDKDLAQLLEPGVRIYNLAKDDWWDAAGVPGRMGVKACQVIDYLALKGDAVDNIPGVKGVGPKAAAALLAEFEDLAAIYDDLDRVETLPVRGAKRLRRKLEDDRDNALLSRKLVDLDRGAPCGLEISDLDYRGADTDDLEAFAVQWGLGRVADRTPRR